jgi:DNA-binding transcriptional LysR family regulator
VHLTPPAVSQQLRALERETGFSVIDRSARQVTLTAAGRILAGHGERIAGQLRQAERDLAELTGRVAGPVRLAAFQSVMRPPGTACDHARQRLAAQTGITVAADDVCVEFPSVIALVAAGRGAAIVPQLSLAAAPVTVCSLPEIGGRRIAALHRAGPARPSPATTAVLNALAEAGQPARRAS